MTFLKSCWKVLEMLFQQKNEKPLNRHFLDIQILTELLESVSNSPTKHFLTGKIEQLLKTPFPTNRGINPTVSNMFPTIILHFQQDNSYYNNIINNK